MNLIGWGCNHCAITWPASAALQQHFQGSYVAVLIVYMQGSLDKSRDKRLD